MKNKEEALRSLSQISDEFTDLICRRSPIIQDSHPDFLSIIDRASQFINNGISKIRLESVSLPTHSCIVDIECKEVSGTWFFKTPSKSYIGDKGQIIYLENEILLRNLLSPVIIHILDGVVKVTKGLSRLRYI